MRHPLVPAVLVVVTLVAYVATVAVVTAGAPGAAATVGGAETENVTVNGTVSDDDTGPVAGAYVLLEPVDGDRIAEATDGDRAVYESLLKLAQTDPDGVVVVRSDAEGRFTASVPPGEYHVVAVTEERASATRTVDATADASVDLSVDDDQVLAAEAAWSNTVPPGGTVTAEVRVDNLDQVPIEGLALTIGELPPGWSLVDVQTAGTYDPDDGTVTFEPVPPGEAATVSLTLSVPAGADTGRYEVDVTAESTTHYVEHHDDVTVRVRAANATPTETGVGGPGAETPRPTTWPPEVTEPSPTGTTASGFGVAAAVAGLVAVVALRGRSPPGP